MSIEPIFSEEGKDANNEKSSTRKQEIIEDLYSIFKQEKLPKSETAIAAKYTAEAILAMAQAIEVEQKAEIMCVREIMEIEYKWKTGEMGTGQMGKREETKYKDMIEEIRRISQR